MYKSPPNKPVNTDPCVPITVYLPRSIAEILDKKSTELGLPKSRLIAYAVDNELDSTHPFNYPVPFPDTPYVPFAFADEAQKVVDYMRRWSTGAGRDMFVVARRDVGIESRNVYLYAFREAVEQGMIEEVKPPRTSKFNRWNGNYLFTRIKSLDPRKLKERRYQTPRVKPKREIDHGQE